MPEGGDLGFTKNDWIVFFTISILIPLILSLKCLHNKPVLCICFKNILNSYELYFDWGWIIIYSMQSGIGCINTCMPKFKVKSEKSTRKYMLQFIFSSYDHI